MKNIVEFKEKIIKEKLKYDEARKLFVKWVNSAVDDCSFKEHYDEGFNFLKHHFSSDIAKLK